MVATQVRMFKRPWNKVTGALSVGGKGLAYTGKIGGMALWGPVSLRHPKGTVYFVYSGETQHNKKGRGMKR